MANNERTMRSAYMEWVKTQTKSVKFNLANSGLMSYPLSNLNVDFSDLALSGPGAYGYPPLKEAIAAKEGVSEDCVTTALGTSGANWLAMAAILNPGDEILMEHPGYPLMWETAEYLGADVHFFDRPANRGFALDLDVVKRAINSKTRLIAITNLHNPSCVQTTESDLRELGVMAQQISARVLVDEVYLDLLGDRTPKSAFHLGPAFVSTNSLTKVYGLSGLRCGWVLADAELTRKMLRLNDLFGVNNPYLTDQISCVALSKLPHIAKWSRDLLSRNMALANEFLQATPELIAEPMTVGTVMFPRVEFSVDKFSEFLKANYDTIVTPGGFFGAPDRLRLAVGGDSAAFSEALNRLHSALTVFVKV